VRRRRAAYHSHEGRSRDSGPETPRRRDRGLVRICDAQLKSVHKDLLTFQAKTEQRFEAIDAKFEAVDARFDKVDGRLDRLETGVRKLRGDMPGIVGDAMRTVMRARNGKPRKA
jgi:hypothetical protein